MEKTSPQKTLVMKFGGTSIGSVEAMTLAIDIVQRSRRSWPRLVVVTSALSGVTNLLLDNANRSALGDRDAYRPAAVELRQRHAEIIQNLVTDPAQRAQLDQEINQLIEDFCSRCQAIAILGELTPRVLDSIAGLGERMSVRVLSAALQCAGIPAAALDATRLIVSDNQFESAHPDLEATTFKSRQVLDPILSEGTVAVVTGF
ncbi:MAG: aspartate kinase, partial [Anaerolineaceae bacterium]|nr:aspartate kinase [Anaerolineaceae bacterium]